LSDRVQQYAAKPDGDELRTCHGCGEKGASLKKCGRCLLFCYCDAACHAAGWNQKGHKEDCKLLRDPDLSTLMKVGPGGLLGAELIWFPLSDTVTLDV
jgi:hypothetical protein